MLSSCTPCRYFLHIWPELAFLAYDSGHCLGTVVCKMDRHKCTNMMRGYLAMLVVEKPYRALGVGERGCWDGLGDILLRGMWAAALAPGKPRRAVEWVSLDAARLGRLLAQAAMLVVGRVCRDLGVSGWGCYDRAKGRLWVRESLHVLLMAAGTELVKRAIQQMVVGGCEEVVLEAEVSNTGALALYQNLGFIRDKRLHK